MNLATRQRNLKFYGLELSEQYYPHKIFSNTHGAMIGIASFLSFSLNLIFKLPTAPFSLFLTPTAFVTFHSLFGKNSSPSSIMTLTFVPESTSIFFVTKLIRLHLIWWKCIFYFHFTNHYFTIQRLFRLPVNGAVVSIKRCQANVSSSSFLSKKTDLKFKYEVMNNGSII